jgi:hypothetical protein
LIGQASTSNDSQESQDHHNMLSTKQRLELSR